MKVVLKKATIIDAQSEFNQKQKDVLIENGVITQIEDSIEITDCQIVASKNLHVSTGWIDLSVHLKDPGHEADENLETLAKVAQNGGFTGIVTMPNTKPTIQTKEGIAYLKHFFQDKSVEVLPAAAVTKNCEGKDFTDMIDLHHAGAKAFTDGSQPLWNADIFLKTLQYLSQFGGVLFNRPQDQHLAMFGQMHEGLTSTLLGMKGIPSLAEELMIIRDLELLSFAFQNRAMPEHIILNFSCISSKRSVELIREAKKSGLPVSATVASHQLAFTDEDLMTFDTNLRVSPPFRLKSDQDALRSGLADGTIDCIVSDHNPFTEESKNLEFDLAEFGVIGLETLFAVALQNSGLSLEKLIEKLTTSPRNILGLQQHKIGIGEKANLTIFDPNLGFNYSAKNIGSSSKNSPFLNQDLTGRAVAIYNNNQLSICDDKK
jgi:dihydroorotase